MINLSCTAGDIDLPDPVLGDSEQLDISTIFQISMSKQVHSVTKQNPTSKLLLNFVDVKQEIFEAFVAWYMSARGQLVTYTDYGLQEWTGIISNNPLEVTVSGRKEYSNSGGDFFEVANFTVELEVSSI